MDGKAGESCGNGWTLTEESARTDVQREQRNAGYGVIYLAACAIHGTEPERGRLQQTNLKSLYQMSKKHALEAIAYMAIESILAQERDVLFPVERENTRALLKRWKKDKAEAICKNLLLDAEREEILRFMEKEKIWYLPLKGIILKELYPKAGMCQMADNDILYDTDGQEKLFAFMTSRGYREVQIKKGNHDIYKKPPVYNYEMHTSLYGPYSAPGWEAYYADVKQRLIKDRDKEYGWHFCDEDFYIYFVTHAYKHYAGGGTGLRSLLDSYVYLRKKRETLHWIYIKAELEKLGIAKFEKQFRELGEKVFSIEKAHELEEFQAEEKEMLDYILFSGTYGTMENMVKHELEEMKAAYNISERRAKFKYLKNRILPDERYFKVQCPFAYRHLWARPFVLLFRVIRGVACRREKVWKEWRVLWKRKRK